MRPHQPHPAPPPVVADALGRIPSELHDTLRWYIAWRQAISYQQGYQQALNDIAGRTAELDTAWRPRARRTHEQQVADRIAQLRARPNHTGNTWQGDYPGGPVDYDTGRLQADPHRPTPAELHAGHNTTREAA